MPQLVQYPQLLLISCTGCTLEKIRCAQWLAALVLDMRTIGEQHMSISDFMDSWKNAVPEQWRNDLKIDAIEVCWQSSSHIKHSLMFSAESCYPAQSHDYSSEAGKQTCRPISNHNQYFGNENSGNEEGQMA